MGIYDRSPEESEPVPWENSKHHYFFAHYALRVAAFQHHLMMFPILTSPERADFFNTLLQPLGQIPGSRGGQAGLQRRGHRLRRFQH